MESDRLEEIFIDEFSVRVCGDYMYYPEAVPTEYVDISEKGVPITSVTLWGISDTDSWLSSTYPLIFNDDLSRKPAFDGMIEAVKNLE